MRTTQWARAAEIFADIIELPVAERFARLNALCGADVEQRSAVQRLLDLEDRPDAGIDLELGVHQAVSAGSLVGELHAGGVLGPFRIVRSLGEGGMGQVYLAERDIDGGVQRVALKIPQQRPGRQFIERFVRERSILAGLSHPAIARLVDSGTLGDARPYFAMEYVDGLAITEYCDQHRLSVKERLRLFMKVLPAVQHAHENLVLHRDIKPANVLVGNDGLPRLLDFGIAKSVDVLANHALTQDEARFFSLASAAPEQITGAATSVATDIYALGVLLYELVCGLAPLDLQDMAPSQVLSAISEQVPTLPAAAIMALARRDQQRARDLAAKRSLGGAVALSRQCRGDLGLILARALRKTPRARYASAEAFARDLQALLELRPIAQRHSDHLYRVGRFVRRHRVAMLSLGLVVAFSAAYLWFAWRQSEALAIARDRAEAGRAQAEQVTEFLVGLFRNADPTVARGSNPDAKQLLERGASALQTELSDQPELRATLMSTLADIYLALNDFPNARSHAEQAVAIRTAAGLRDLATHRASLEQLANVALSGARYADAQKFIDEALQLRKLDQYSDDIDLRLFGLRAAALSGSGARESALPVFAAVEAEMRRRYGHADPRTRALQRSWSLTLFAVGLEQPSQALARVAAGGASVLSFSNDPDSFQQAYRQSASSRDGGDLAVAERTAREALRIATVVYGEWHAKTASAYNLLGTIAQEQINYDASAAHFDRALTIVERLFPVNHPRRASAQYNVGLLHLLYRDDAAAALPHLRSAVDQAAQSLPSDHPNLAIFRFALGQALRDSGDYPAARTQLELALKRFVATPGPPGRSQAGLVGEIACIDLVAEPQQSVASESLHRSLALLEQLLSAGHPSINRLKRCLPLATQQAAAPLASKRGSYSTPPQARRNLGPATARWAPSIPARMR